MATPVDPAALDPQVKSLQDQINQKQSNIDNSVTGASSTLMPTKADVSNETQSESLQTQLRTLQKKQLTADWYGNDTTGSPDTGDASSGIIGTALNTLSKPLYGIVGGIKSLMGEQGNGKEDFSDLLKEHNVPYPISAPLGFALDVAADPINWLTAGTGALIPRIGVGLVKGGIEGAYLGAKSSLLEKGATVAKYIPGMGGDTGTVAKTLSTNANKAWETYKGITGVDPLAHIDTPGIARGTQFAWGSGANLAGLAKGVLSYLPKGDDLYKSLYYSPRDWLDNQRLRDAVERYSAKTVEDIKVGNPAETAIADNPALTSGAGQSALSNPLIRPNLSILDNVPKGSERDALIDQFNKMADDASYLDRTPKAGMTTNPEEATYRLLQEAKGRDELQGLLQRMVDEQSLTGETGVKTYDNAVKWANGVKVKIGDKEIQPIKEFLDVYHSFINGVFKPAHTFLSPSTAMMNYLSSWPIYKLIGGETGPLAFYKTYNRGYGAMLGFDPRTFVLNKFLTKDNVGTAWQELLDKNAGTVRQSLGVGPAWFSANSNKSLKEMVDTGRTAGIFNAETDDQALQAIQDFNSEMAQNMREGTFTEKKPNFLKTLLKGTTAPDSGTPSDIVSSLRKTLKGRVPAEADLPAGFTVRDPQLENPVLDKIDAWIKAKADSGSKPAQVYQSFMDKARAGYEHEDQAARMAIAIHLTQDGLSENGIKVMSRFSPFNRETDLMEKYVKDGKTMYRIAPMKALDIANDAMINYGAMPSAIRMLRSIPLIGGPFASFTYGMGLRTAQSLAYNPSIFNKVAFGIKAASGNKTPLEREALNPPADQPNYYGWYNDPAMFRMPVNFFDQYPLYLNLSNMLPYYSLNTFQPSNRTYNSVLPNAIVQTLDRSPIMKDPIGQSIFDYFVLPSILQGTGERPTNSIGSPLYPMTATPTEKLGYYGRSVADSFTPNVVAPVGAVVPADLGQYLPGFRTRQFAEGKDQRNQLGIPGSESAASRQIRNLLSYMGIPMQRLDTTFAASQANTTK